MSIDHSSYDWGMNMMNYDEHPAFFLAAVFGYEHGCEAFDS